MAEAAYAQMQAEAPGGDTARGQYRANKRAKKEADAAKAARDVFLLRLAIAIVVAFILFGDVEALQRLLAGSRGRR